MIKKKIQYKVYECNLLCIIVYVPEESKAEGDEKRGKQKVELWSWKVG